MAITRYRSDNGWKHHSQLSPPVAANPCSSTTVGAPGGPAASRMNVVPRPGSSTNRPAGTIDGGAANVLALGLILRDRRSRLSTSGLVLESRRCRRLDVRATP